MNNLPLFCFHFLLYLFATGIAANNQGSALLMFLYKNSFVWIDLSLYMSYLFRSHLTARTHAGQMDHKLHDGGETCPWVFLLKPLNPLNRHPCVATVWYNLFLKFHKLCLNWRHCVTTPPTDHKVKTVLWVLAGVKWRTISWTSYTGAALVRPTPVTALHPVSSLSCQMTVCALFCLIVSVVLCSHLFKSINIHVIWLVDGIFSAY